MMGSSVSRLREIEIIDEEKMRSLPPFVSKEEVELFQIRLLVDFYVGTQF